MTRETVPVKSIIQIDDYEELHDDYIVREYDQVGFDSEKGYADIEVIYERIDGKFFKLAFTDYGKGNDNLKDQDLVEVFPVVITNVIYT